MQGEAFKVMQRALDNGLEAKILFPLIAGFAVIFVFCLMIGFLILQPDSKGQEAKRKAMEARHQARARAIAAKTFCVQIERKENKVKGKQAHELDNQVYVPL